MSGGVRTNDVTVFDEKHAGELESVPLEASDAISLDGRLEAANPNPGTKELPKRPFVKPEAAVEFALGIGNLSHVAQSKFFQVWEIVLCVHVDQHELPTLLIDERFVFAQLSELFTGKDSAVVPEKTKE